MKFTKKMIIIGLMAIFFLNFWNANIAFAVKLEDLETNAKDFTEIGKKEAEKSNLGTVLNSVTTNFQGLGQILTMVGAGVIVAVISYMGIKYLVSPPDKQAALKQQLIGVVVAGIVIFGAYGIWSAILGVVSHF